MTRLDERGSITLWMLGLGVLLLTLGGVSLDLWRIVADRREVAAVADAAATAGASALDEAVWRASGTLVLDPGEAERRALASVGVRGPGWEEAEVAVRVEGGEIVVRLRRSLSLTLLRLAHPEPIVVGAESRAAARLKG